MCELKERRNRSWLLSPYRRCCLRFALSISILSFSSEIFLLHRLRLTRWCFFVGLNLVTTSSCIETMNSRIQRWRKMKIAWFMTRWKRRWSSLWSWKSRLGSLLGTGCRSKIWNHGVFKERKFADLIKNNQWAGSVSRAAVRSHCDSLASEYASATPWLKGKDKWCLLMASTSLTLKRVPSKSKTWFYLVLELKLQSLVWIVLLWCFFDLIKAFWFVI